jgi:uncharacterized alpha-E superfamily protein
MLSRVAENLYWMARYLERAEDTARVVNVYANLLLDLPRSVRPGWAPLVAITGNEQLFGQHYGAPDERSAVKFLIADLTNPGSILSSLGCAREDARTVRDYLPRESWEQLNELYLHARNNLPAGLGNKRRYEYLRAVILGVQQVTGLLAGTMTHDEGYQFLRMGRNLERADMTIRIVDVRSANLLPDSSEDLTPFENIQWMSVLKSLSAYQMYRRAMQAPVRRPDVLKFLFKERLFPRAFYHAISEVDACLRALPRREVPITLLQRIRELVTGSHPETMTQEQLHRFIDGLEQGLNTLHSAISETYFMTASATPVATGTEEIRRAVVATE